MSNLRGNIFIIESTNEIEGKILRALKPELNKYLEKVFSKVKSRIIDTVVNAITSAPEYNSLLSGDLKYEFGLPDSDSRVSSILNFWKKINTDYKSISINNNKLSGGFTITMINSDYSDVINSAAAVLTTEKGVDLNWLEWLLLFGNRTIIKDYVVEFGVNPRSRTGRAIMRGVQKGKWSVPNEFSGTKNNNWITRAIDSVDTEINSILKEAMK
jgi:hypothetical protein